MSKKSNDVTEMQEMISAVLGSIARKQAPEHTLTELTAMLTGSSTNFIVGDMVVFKCEQLRNRGMEEAGIVTRFLDEPQFDTSGGSGSPYFIEPLDVVVAFLDNHGDLIELALDSRRLMRVQ